jgi:two-component system, oxyanion-binding sensor
MKTNLKLGFNPLNDCAPIAIAQEMGFFSQEGLEVSIEREISWSNIRDKLSYGLIDAAHILAPIPLANSIGIGPSLGDLIVPLALNTGGNSFVVANEIFDKIEIYSNPNDDKFSKTALAFNDLIKERKKNGQARIIIAIPFIHSAHNFMMKNWIAKGGADPDNDVQILVLPPSKMAQMLEDGVIDGFCAGAPWPQTTQLNNKGKILFSDPDFMDLKLEKVLGVRKAFATQNPLAIRALTRAIMRGGKWCSKPENHGQLFEILASNKYVNAPIAAIKSAFENNSAGLNFDPKMIGAPKIECAKWCYDEFEKWGMISHKADFAKAAEATFQTQLWREIALTLEFEIPPIAD